MNKYKNQIGLIGLNDSSECLLRNLTRNCFSVLTYDLNKSKYEELKKEGFTCFDSLDKFVNYFLGEKIVLLTGNWNRQTNNIFLDLINMLNMDSIIIDLTDSSYDVVVSNYQKAKNKNIEYVDASIIGTLDDITWGFSLAISGKENTVRYLQNVLKNTLSHETNFFFSGAIGSAHFLKMIHDSIQNSYANSILEGLDLMRRSPFDFNFKQALNFFENGNSLIQSRILSLLNKADINKEKDNSLLTDDVVNLNSAQNYIKHCMENKIYSQTNSSSNFSILKLKDLDDDFKKMLFKNLVSEIKSVEEDE